MDEILDVVVTVVTVMIVNTVFILVTVVAVVIVETLIFSVLREVVVVCDGIWLQYNRDSNDNSRISDRINSID